MNNDEVGKEPSAKPLEKDLTKAYFSDLLELSEGATPETALPLLKEIVRRLKPVLSKTPFRHSHLNP